MYRIAIVQSASNNRVSDFNIEADTLGPDYDLRVVVVNDARDMIGQLDDIDGIIGWYPVPFDREVLQALPRCKIIVRAAVGYDDIDVKAANENGIRVCNVPDYGNEEVADHAMSLLLAMQRNLFYVDSQCSQGIWRWNNIGDTRRLRGMKLGLVGCGRIGTAVSIRAKAFGINVAFYDPYVSSGTDKALGIERYESLEEMLADCDIVSMHAPLTSETEKMINSETLAHCKSGILFVNTARGALVDSDDLLAAIDRGIIRYAGLDVLAEEPEIHEGLAKHPKVILTAHSAFYSNEGLMEVRVKSALNIRRFFDGHFVRDEV